MLQSSSTSCEAKEPTNKEPRKHYRNSLDLELFYVKSSLSKVGLLDGHNPPILLSCSQAIFFVIY